MDLLFNHYIVTSFGKVFHFVLKQRENTSYIWVNEPCILILFSGGRVQRPPPPPRPAPIFKNLPTAALSHGSTVVSAEGAAGTSQLSYPIAGGFNNAILQLLSSLT